MPNSFGRSLIQSCGNEIRPCERRLLPKFLFLRVSVIDVFWKLGLERVIRAFTELVPTRENSFRLKNDSKVAKNRKKLCFSELLVITSFGNSLLPKFPKLAKTKILEKKRLSQGLSKMLPKKTIFFVYFLTAAYCPRRDFYPPPP